MTLADEAEADAQAGQAIELRKGTRDDEVAVLLHQRSDIGRVGRDEAGVGLVDEDDGIRRNVLHDTSDLIGSQSVTRRVVGRSQQQHTGMYAVGIFNHLVHVVGKGVVLLMQRVHLVGAATLVGHLVIVPPRELGDENLLVVAHHQEVVDGVLQHILAAVCQQHLVLRHVVDFTQTDRDDTLLALVVYSGIKT